MTEQEIFDKSVAGLASQDFDKCLPNPEDSDKRCMYNGPNGRHCAIGWVIEGVQLTDRQERMSINSLFGEVQAVREMLADVNRSFIEELQSAHDSAQAPTLMKQSLTRVAKKYGLTLPDVLRD